jgi:hypothetical protein
VFHLVPGSDLGQTEGLVRFETRFDKRTGEILQLRHEPDADLHFEGDGDVAWRVKFVSRRPFSSWV